MRINVTLGVLLAIGSGCTAAPPADGLETIPAHGDTGHRCDAAPAQALLGQPASDALAREAQRLSGAGTVRWLTPGQIVTMEFQEGRLNIVLDDRNRVAALRCG